MADAKDLFGVSERGRGPQDYEMLKRLGFGAGTTGKQAGNFNGVIVDATFSSTAAQAFTHGLGRVPVFCFPIRAGNAAGAVVQYISATISTITLACNVAGATFKLYVE